MRLDERMTMLPAAASPLDTVSLVQLRALLDQARSVSRTVSRATRLVAVVLLDAVNERAMHVVATSRGIAIKKDEPFDGLKSKVHQALGTAWNLEKTTWREVTQLRDARNLAQHRGIGADRDELAAWRAATERFSRTLIEAAFNLDLEQVLLSEAIANRQIRQLVGEAERHLRESNASGAMKVLKEAFDIARKAWVSAAHQRQPRSPRVFTNRATTTKNMEDYLEELISRLQDSAIDQVFATSPSEAMWFAQIATQSPDIIDLDEVDRALSYVFWWIVGWSTKIRQTAAGPVPEHTWWVKFELADVPPEDAFGRWAQALRKVTAGNSMLSSMQIDDIADVTLPFPSEVVETSQLVQEFGRALVQAEEEVIATLRTEQQQESETKTALEAFQAEVDRWRPRLPGWVIGVKSADIRHVGTSSLIVEVVPGTSWSAAKNLHEVVGVRGCQAVGSDELHLSRLELRELVQHLQQVDPVVAGELDAAAAEQAELRAERERIAAYLNDAIARLNAAT